MGVQDTGPVRISKLQKKKLFKKFEKEKRKPSQGYGGVEETRTGRKRRIKFCPRCGSTDLFWASGLPQLWSIWECKCCGYRGALVLEDSVLAERLREDYARKAIR